MKNSLTTKTNTQAFSLVEVLVSITILLLVVVTPMTIVTRANNSTAFANEQMVAFFLAQEGLELVEKGRNDFYLQHFRTTPAPLADPMAGFLAAYTTCVGNNASCGVQMHPTTQVVTVSSCGTTNGCRLYRATNSTDRSQYRHVTGAVQGGTVATPFTRQINITRTPATGKLREARVTSTVTWRTGSLIAGQTVTLVTYLSNMYDTD